MSWDALWLAAFALLMVADIAVLVLVGQRATISYGLQRWVNASPYRVGWFVVLISWFTLHILGGLDAWPLLVALPLVTLVVHVALHAGHQ